MKVNTTGNNQLSGKSVTTPTTPKSTTGNAASKGPSNAGVDVMGNVTGYDQE